MVYHAGCEGVFGMGREGEMMNDSMQKGPAAMAD